MSLAVERAGFFHADFARRFAWYLDQASEEIAMQFETALEDTIQVLARQPELGRVRHFRDPRLHGLRSFRVQSPFRKLIIFYRIQGHVLDLVRLMHGARNLGRRLVEPPRTDEE